MKQKIKNIIAGIPGIKGFMAKWIKAREDIEYLQKREDALTRQSRRYGVKFKNIESNIDEANEAAHRALVIGDMNYLRLDSYMRRTAYSRLQNGEQLDAHDMKLADEHSNLMTSRHKVSIVMLNRNGRHNLEILMESMHRSSFYDNFEIICVDNASTDDSIEYLETWNKEFDIKVIRNSENMSFSAANNIGVRASDGDLLLFLNNDTEVTDGWLDELIIALDKMETPGAIGAKLIYPHIPAGTVNAGKSFTIQHDGIMFKDAMREDAYFIQPYNTGNGEMDGSYDYEIKQRACVTAAVLLVTRTAFDAIGGFDERYIYGYEDVDLCLKLHKAGYKNYYCPKSLVYHYEFGTQSKDEAESVRLRRLNNMEVFKGKWQKYLSMMILGDKLAGKHIFTEDNLTVAMVVTEANMKTTAGDFFTALEFAHSLEKQGFNVKYLSRRGLEDWYNVGLEVDVLISLLDAYDLSKIYNNKNDLITVAWARNWFDRWCVNPSFDKYDMVWASSRTACEYVRKQTGREAVLFPIATNRDRFYTAERAHLSEEDKEHFVSDYAFTGSYWNVKRDIIGYLRPDEFDYVCKIYGANWDQVDSLKDYSEGFITYPDIPKVYQNTRIVIDDANHVTKQYGAVNSRVFDALAAGALVLTNGKIGAEETFEGMLPSFETEEEFRSKLTYYLEHEDERQKLVSKLQSFVLENHTYDSRAKKLRELLEGYAVDHLDDREIDICGAMPDSEIKKSWGDQHFALAMKKQFEKLGYKVNVLPRDRWYDRSSAKYVIVLRGIKRYYPSVMDGRKNIMWNISHPEDVDIPEYNEYDYVFFASEKMAKLTGPKIYPKSSALLQCTDEEVMRVNENSDSKYELLFVGNSRHVYRKILRDLLPTDHRLTVIGSLWEDTPVKEYVVAKHLENEKVGQAYHDAKILLNDHWDDMRELGIVSNRIFDALAAGAFVISDYIPEIDELFDGCVVTYKDKEDLRSKVDYYLKHDDERMSKAKRGQEIVLKSHTFRNRIEEMDRVIRECLAD